MVSADRAGQDPGETTCLAITTKPTRQPALQCDHRLQTMVEPEALRLGHPGQALGQGPTLKRDGFRNPADSFPTSCEAIRKAASRAAVSSSRLSNCISRFAKYRARISATAPTSRMWASAGCQEPFSPVLPHSCQSSAIVSIIEPEVCSAARVGLLRPRLLLPPHVSPRSRQ